jgi:hypothetical protein
MVGGRELRIFLCLNRYLCHRVVLTKKKYRIGIEEKRERSAVKAIENTRPLKSLNRVCYR